MNSISKYEEPYIYYKGSMMISLIICSRTTDVPNGLKENVAKTIGVEYEWVVIDNSKNEHSIFEAYNKGVARSKGDILCFMHDDILYHTEGWGNIVLRELNSGETGILGVAGGHYLPQCPASWWSTECRSGQLLQQYKKNGSTYQRHDNWTRYRNDVNTLEVAAVDGFWFCMPRNVLSSVRFDTSTYNGFHCYDIDICMQLLQYNKQVRVSFDILIEHFSEGNQNRAFIEARKIWYKKWKTYLPVLRGVELSNNEILDRLALVKELNRSAEAYHKAIEETQGVRHSYSYRIGKLLLAPINFIKKRL